MIYALDKAFKEIRPETYHWLPVDLSYMSASVISKYSRNSEYTKKEQMWSFLFPADLCIFSVFEMELIRNNLFLTWWFFPKVSYRNYGFKLRAGQSLGPSKQWYLGTWFHCLPLTLYKSEFITGICCVISCYSWISNFWKGYKYRPWASPCYSVSWKSTSIQSW